MRSFRIVLSVCVLRYLKKRTWALCVAKIGIFKIGVIVLSLYLSYGLEKYGGISHY